MTTKEWLSQARHMEKRLKALEKSKRRAYERATSAENKNNSYGILSDEVDRQVETLNEKKAEITKVIGQVQDNILATVLTEYYVNGKSCEDIAEIMNFTSRHVSRLRKMALEQVECVLQCHN